MNNYEKKYELIKFEDGEFSLDVNVSPDEETVWLTQKDLTLLFNVDKSRISRHIKNILDEGELDFSVVAENALTASDKQVMLYSLDVNVSPDEDTVWLSQKDMSLLFYTDLSRISRHIKNIFTEMELDKERNLRKTQFPYG